MCVVTLIGSSSVSSSEPRHACVALPKVAWRAASAAAQGQADGAALLAAMAAFGTVGLIDDAHPGRRDLGPRRGDVLDSLQIACARPACTAAGCQWTARRWGPRRRPARRGPGAC